MREMLNELINSWNTRDVERMALYYAADYEGKDIGLAQTFHGITGMRQMTNLYYSAFPDLSFTLTQTIAQAECAALAWIASGTHQGRIMNIPATGRSVKVSGITTLEIQNELIIRSSVLWDVAGLLRDLGLLPDL
jgi:steroid delta-isomerase-like uncharacterized protein